MKEDENRQKELRKLKKIFKNIPEKKRKVCERLVENAAFMAVELDKLQEHIALHGATETYQNGENQSGRKKSAEVEVYNTMIKNYTTVIKQLIELIPEEQRVDDELMEFLKR